MLRQNRVVIDLNAIRRNYQMLKDNVPADVAVMPVIKANAYGHGMVETARALSGVGASHFAVALPEEGIDLRLSGVQGEILVLGAAMPVAAPDAVAYRLTQTVFTPEMVALLEKEAQAQGGEALVHIKLDTGMNRIGVRTEDEVRTLVRLIDSLPGIELTGCFTHMATADEEDASGTRAQIARFETLCDAIASVHPQKIIRHAANTASIFRYPQAHADMVRGGIALYGYPPVPEAAGLMPAMRWVTRGVFVKTIQPGDRVSYGGVFEAKRPTVVMTLPVGYADGYRRGISGKGCVLVRGKRAPIIGRVCMDQMMVDVTDIPGAQAGDEVVLLGRQGDERIDAEEMAAWLDTISYEVLCSPSRRVPRVYINA